VRTRVTGAPSATFRRPDGRDCYLHSRVDPRDEARFLVADVPLQERALYIVLGFGLGYHVEALLHRVPRSSHVVVIEPAGAALSGVTCRPRKGRAPGWTRDARLHVHAHHDATLAATHVADRLTAHHLTAIHVVPHLPSMQTAPPFYETLSRTLPALLPATIQQQLNLLDKMLEGDLRNFWANLSSSWNEASPKALADAWKGRPLVLVSGGPSLTAQIERLAVLRDRALVLATGSTVRTLIDRGITPDLIVSVDPYDLNLAHFVGWDGSGVPLVYYHRIHCGIPRVYTGPMAAFRMHDEPPLPLLDAADPSPFSRGGTVAFSGLQLAHFLGADPIIFVGQDFAFADGRTHAEGAIYNDRFDPAAPPPDYVGVPGVQGTPVVTSRLLQLYLLHMQDYILQRAPLVATAHINTSMSGARIGGTIQATLDAALAPFTPLDAPPRAMLAAALSRRTPPPPQAQTAAIRGWLDELEPIVAEIDALGPDALFDRLAATTLFTVPGRGYADMRYVYEAKYQRGAHEASALFASRLRHHLRQVLDDLRHESAAL